MPHKKIAVPVAAELLEKALSGFIAGCQIPVLQEHGEKPIPLRSDHFVFTQSSNRLLLSAWDENHTWNRRILDVGSRQAGRLTLVIEKFGGRQAEAWIYDAGRPEGQDWDRRGNRMIFREQFRRMLQRTYSGWRITELSSEKDLEHTLSANYPRALLTQGSQAWAAISAGQDPDLALSFGLIWLQYARRRHPKLSIAGLALFLPAGKTTATALRLRWLDSGKAQFQIYAYEGDAVDLLDPCDWGNLQTSLEVCRHSVLSLPPWIVELGTSPGVESVPLAGGVISFRLAGLEFARWREGELHAGVDGKHPHTYSQLTELQALAAELGGLRRLPGSLLYQRAPEAWLESTLRRDLALLDPCLLSDPVYGQVPTLSGSDRSIADLLAIDRHGRLCVIEVKAAEDIHLPLQALDYWMRVAWHAERNEFRNCGYFPGLPISADRPRLILVAPALEFHPTTETILSFFSSFIEVERVGVGVKWRESIQLLFRLDGATNPGKQLWQ